MGKTLSMIQYAYVALRKESVDRNHDAVHSVSAALVALRKESVDRNLEGCAVKLYLHGSLSARRAWIEMTAFGLSLPRPSRRSPQGERG